MKTKIRPIIKNNLQKYRYWKNLTQQQLADELEISVGLVRKIELDDHVPKYYTRWKIATYFGVSESQMFYREVLSNE
jgi:transcriptional regulator with XRE-family HTH domain